MLRTHPITKVGSPRSMMTHSIDIDPLVVLMLIYNTKTY